MKSKIKLKILFLLIVLTSGLSFSQVKLPKLVSDGMVLQRDANIRIWDWASNNEKVTIGFQYAPRAYKIPENLLKQGKNTVIVRITNYIHHDG